MDKSEAYYGILSSPARARFISLRSVVLPGVIGWPSDHMIQHPLRELSTQAMTSRLKVGDLSD